MHLSIHTIIENYSSLKQRLEWLRSFANYISNITKRSADLYFRSTEIPRDSGWRDDFIYELVEIADKSRKICDEVSEKIEKNIVENLTENEMEISKLIVLMKKEIKNNVEEEDGLYLELKNKKDAHKAVWDSPEGDPWLSEFELKNVIDQYFAAREEKESFFDGKRQEYERRLDEYVNRYENIVKYFVEITKSHFMDIASLYNCDNIFNSSKFKFYDAKGNESIEESTAKKENLSEIFFDDTLESIKNELKNDKFIKKIEVKKYFICKHKGSGFYKLKFLVLTEYNFLHFFDLVNLEKKFPNYTILIKKLNEIPSNKFTSFILSTDDSLTKKEESELKELTKLIYKDLSSFPICKSSSLFLTDKKTRINRNKIELSIFEKSKNQILGLFPAKVIKVKGFIINDLYELLYYLEEKVKRNDSKEDIQNESINNEESTAQEGIMEIKEDVPLLNIEEDNPWNA